ncbi:hypothetical protein ABT187_46510 [Streptomyces sp. NPDC001817]|uniref:hypothetical protein n=1 Tax=Streptomyces sp. NPDC001817 TaxID=3154398 RepID=UPI00332FE544
MAVPSAVVPHGGGTGLLGLAGIQRENRWRVPRKQVASSTTGGDDLRAVEAAMSRRHPPPDQ